VRACDLTTAYGYGGPFAWNVTPEETRGFWDRFDEWAGNERVISSFARLSLFPETLLPFNGKVEIRNTNFVRRLDLPEGEIWTDYLPKVRKNVQRARGLGVSVEADPAGTRLDTFLEIYTATMNRRIASGEYYHPRPFFEAIVRDLAGHFCFFHALSGGKVVSTELVLFSEERAYSFLGGSLEEAFGLRATDLLKHEIILHCRRVGKQAFVLGGGREGEDGIHRFKKALAPRGELAFRVGERVYDSVLAAHFSEERRRYEAVRGNDWHPRPQYFPAYRA
jgi:lipid II:glycine glycyltransferase (peptidoglycan interpeptide bridge formation enzyme)